MESIQRMVPQDSPLIALAQQGAKAVTPHVTNSLSIVINALIKDRAH
jgi:hypothetical protein